MPTRRQMLFVMGNGFVLSGLSGSSASLATESSSGASFRVVADADDIELTPTNDRPVYVQTDADGFVSEFTLGDDGGVNTRAITRFEDIVQITNVSTDAVEGVYFSFDATSDSLSGETLDAIEAAMQATAADRTLESTGLSGDDLLAVSPNATVADGELEPGESVPFGLQVDLAPSSEPGHLEDLPPSDDYELTLRVHTVWPDG
ncbi:hypothetical protein [Haloferax sp. YSSS75]|uniref:hypothetical protein n=1 Tax=Haloferax sp. YSSS75 TaxID=3388564 RepID=UPI00398D1860